MSLRTLRTRPRPNSRVRTRALLPLLLVPAYLAAAGCSSSDDGAADPNTTAAASASTTSASTTAAPRPTTTAPGATIGVADFTFQAATVPAGATVRMLNGDSTAHTVESRDGLWTFDTSTETFPAPATAGSYAIFCGIHSSMAGTLTVA